MSAEQTLVVLLVVLLTGTFSPFINTVVMVVYVGEFDCCVTLLAVYIYRSCGDRVQR